MRRKKVELDDASYDIREIPASLLRRHQDLTSGAAQMDMLGLCVLNGDGKPMGDGADEEIPMRHVEPLITAIAELSGFAEGNADAPATAITS